MWLEAAPEAHPYVPVVADRNVRAECVGEQLVVFEEACERIVCEDDLHVVVASGVREGVEEEWGVDGAVGVDDLQRFCEVHNEECFDYLSRSPLFSTFLFP